MGKKLTSSELDMRIDSINREGLLFDICKPIVNQINSKVMVTIFCHATRKFSNYSLSKVLLWRKCHCLNCKKLKTSNQRSLPNSLWVKKFIGTGKFPLGTEFIRGFGSKWTVICPKCSLDDYAIFGKFPIEFVSTTNNLAAGRVPCRCSGKYRFSLEERVFQIEQMIREEKLDCSLTHITGSTIRDHVYLECKEHGEFRTTINNLVHSDRRCPECARRSSIYFYVIKVEDASPIALKIGVSCTPRRRIRDIRRSTLYDVSFIGVYSFTDKNIARSVESYLKRELDCGILCKREMPAGHSETTDLINLEFIQETITQYGGIEIDYY